MILALITCLFAIGKSVFWFKGWELGEEVESKQKARSYGYRWAAVAVLAAVYAIFNLQRGVA